MRPRRPSQSELRISWGAVCLGLALALCRLEMVRGEEPGSTDRSKSVPASVPAKVSAKVSADVPPDNAGALHVAAAERAAVRAAAVRAVAYLSREVPGWRPEHGCSSCHHNGDGARALFAATRANLAFPRAAVEETAGWLAQPRLWDANGPQGPFNDKRLATLQFSAALGAAVAAGFVPERKAISEAADQLVREQSADGSWGFVGADEIGSPVTYGRALATTLAVRVLRQADERRFAQGITRAERWLAGSEPKSVLNAAAVLWGLSGVDEQQAAAPRARCLAILRRGEAPEGGWGPYVDADTEPFDTAVVLCAVVESSPPGWTESIRRACDYLRRTQLADGSWPETTRPAHRESLAQRLSTTAWATLALVATLPPAQ